MEIDAVLKERGENYGLFFDHACLTQAIKDAYRVTGTFDSLDKDIKESLEMIAHKIGRIINGNSHYQDSWTDIIGYARLIEEKL